MGKFNKYHIGDIVGHKESPSLQFRVLDVLTMIPEKEGSYGYAKTEIFEGEELEMEEIFSSLHRGIYMEGDLFFIRKPTLEELNILLGEALGEAERFDGIINSIRNIMKSVS